MTTPYGDAAWAYRAAGWLGVLPLPAGAKWPPPHGFTGWAGVDPSGADIQAWCDGPQASGNIALRLPVGVYGLDVDHYAGKSGGAALEALVRQYGPLPATWIVSSREETTSGIRLFRAELEPGTRWRNEPAGRGAGIESIHFGHRYAVVAPSIHPEGRKYVWRMPDGAMAYMGALPRVDELPALPVHWVAGLCELGETRTGEAAGHAETIERVSSWREGEPCERTRDASSRAMAALRTAVDGAALHPQLVTMTHELVSLGHEGHAGVRRALADTFMPFVEIRAGRGGDRGAAEGEWWRAVRGAVGKLSGSARAECDCDLWGGVGLTLDVPWPPIRVDDPALDLAGAGIALEKSYPPVANGAGVTGQDLPVDPATRMLGELLTPAQVAALPAPSAIVSGLLYADTLSWLIGRSGSFKSFIALDLAAHVAAGVPWAGRRTERGGVLFLAAEGGGGLGLRVRAWESERGPMADELRMLRRPIQARGPEWAVLIEMAARIRPRLIVVDTQARVTVGIKENDNTEMGQFIEQIDRLRRATGACVLLVHHIGRSGDDARGASAIDGAQDTELKVERLGGPKALRARLVVDKQKDGPDTAQLVFGLKPIELGVDEHGESISSLVAMADLIGDPFPLAEWAADMPDRLAKMIGVLHDHFAEAGATRAELLGVLRERGWSKDYPKATFYRNFDKLLEMDKLVRIQGTQRFRLIDVEAPV